MTLLKSPEYYKGVTDGRREVVKAVVDILTIAKQCEAPARVTLDKIEELILKEEMR